MSQNRDSDEEILKQSKFIADGLEFLNEKVQIQQVNFIQSLDTMAHYTEERGTELKITKTELLDMMKNYLAINELKRIQYKC